MKRSITITLLLLFIVSGLNANSFLSGFKSTFEKLPLPFHIVKETAEKISSLGLKKLLFGLTSAAMISEYYSSLEYEKEEADTGGCRLWCQIRNLNPDAQKQWSPDL